MPELYLTPSSISYLTLFLLTLMITVYLLVRAIQRGKRFSLRQDAALLTIFASLSLLALLFLAEYSTLPSDRIGPVFLQPVIIDIMLVALIQFAYDFPAPSGKYKLERWLVFLFSCYCLTRDSGIALQRFAQLHQKGE